MWDCDVFFRDTKLYPNRTQRRVCVLRDWRRVRGIFSDFGLYTPSDVEWSIFSDVGFYTLPGMKWGIISNPVVFYTRVLSVSLYAVS